MSDLNSRAARRSLRALALAPAAVLPFLAAPALAAPPETWPEADPVGAVDWLLVLLVIPLGVAFVIALLASVPALARGGKADDRSKRSGTEWFGGPKDGVEAAQTEDSATSAEGERGGSSARW